MTATQSRLDHRHLSMSLSAWVSQLTGAFPGLDEYDIAELGEGGTGLQVSRNDFETVRSLHLRSRFRAWKPEMDGEEK